MTGFSVLGLFGGGGGVWGDEGGDEVGDDGRGNEDWGVLDVVPIIVNIQ